jgi:hypothetical protein
VAESRDDVNYARGETSFDNEVAEREGREGSQFRGLEDDGASGWGVERQCNPRRKRRNSSVPARAGAIFQASTGEAEGVSNLRDEREEFPTHSSWGSSTG